MLGMGKLGVLSCVVDIKHQQEQHTHTYAHTSLRNTQALLTDTPAQHTTRGSRGSQNTAPGGQGGRGTPAAAAGNKTTSNVTTDGTGAATAGAAGVLSRDALQQLRKQAQQRQPLVSRHDVMQHAVVGVCVGCVYGCVCRGYLRTPIYHSA